MNKNTAGAVLILIIAAAGLYRDVPEAWVLAAVTCALAFLAEELRDVGSLHGRPDIVSLASIPALASWVTIITAFTSLLF